MDFQTVKPDLIRYQMRMVQGDLPHEREQKRPGAFGRFLSGVGKVLGAAALPLSILFPPAAIGAAGMYGMSKIGDQMQGRTYTRQMENMQKKQAMEVSYPGLMPASYNLSAQDQEISNVLYSRDRALLEMSKTVR